MKPSCTKVKNPCKICLQGVTNKNGLQCQGACKKWAHFKCLNYTPGKISDIKAGIIKVTCPCPDCETTQPKEFLTNPPFTCSNHQCPANTIPKCQSNECPSNKQVNKQVPAVPSPSRKAQKPIPADYPGECPNKECSNQAIRCPAVECPNSRQESKSKTKPHPRVPPPKPPSPPPPTRRQKSPTKNQSNPCRNSPKSKCYEDSKKKAPAKAAPKAAAKTCPNECDQDKKKQKKKPPSRSRSSSLVSTDPSSICASK